MKEIEHLLKRCKLKRPSEDLENKMKKVFSDQNVVRGGFFSRPIPLWQAALASALFGVVGFILNRSSIDDIESSPGNLEKVYIIRTGGPMSGNPFDFTGGADSFLGHPGKIHVEVRTEPEPDLVKNKMAA